ncbi:hypothetical protein L500_0990 [Bordetella holmesii CDC-H643-BH]|nr:hypothetical protein [Bordetella holmesii]AMD46238.1 hypothetical protein H558_12460 [Bordetella holmesii H558]AMD50522.1 hypothetical protein F783_005605 [Bordetella holmesii F627]KAK87073.1 hypothetical protein L496_0566 [Bordetella holmesii CDC-H572-BH]KAK87229.1 hypothetical protein L573_0920 [Bordetella holmesii H620]KAL00482.1 hypothetical protein L497_0580 [Bordetella holmesii CDC-H585-BH]KCV02497.1 hypothetical protein L498_0934 [Bordetella holmesii CDC-H629-BH]KCV04508.1 hypothet
MLLNWHGQKTGKPEFSQAAAAIEQTIANTISAGQCTRDVGGSLGTREAGAAFVSALSQA